MNTNKNGFHEEKWNNGFTKIKGTYTDGVRDGLFEFYDENGRLEIGSNFKPPLNHSRLTRLIVKKQ